MDINIRRLSLFLAGSLPPYYREPLSKSHFAEVLSVATDGEISTDRFKDLVGFSSKDEEYFFMCLEKARNSSEEYIGNFISQIERIDSISIPDDAKHSLATKTAYDFSWKPDSSLPEKILIIEDEKWVTVWESFLDKFSIKGIKVVASKGCSIEKWEEALKLNRQLNNAYNPLVFRIIDRDWFTDAQLSKMEEYYVAKYSPALNYRFKILSLNEIENFVLLEPAYQMTPLHKKTPDVRTFVLPNRDLELKFKETIDQRINQCKAILWFEAKKQDFEAEKLEMEEEMKIDPVRRLNWKDIIKIMKREFLVTFDAERFLKDLDKDTYPKELTELLKEIKNFFW